MTSTVSEAGPVVEQGDTRLRFDMTAEKVVLGALMIPGAPFDETVGVLRGSQDFFREAHRLIFNKLLELREAGRSTDLVEVSGAMDVETLRKVGGAPYLHDCMSEVPTAANGPWYAGKVRRLAVLRDLAAHGTRVMQLASGTSADDVDQAVEWAQKSLADITTATSTSSLRPWSELVTDVLGEVERTQMLAEKDELPGISTGWADVDKLLNNLHPGQVVVIGGRPGTGKSNAGLNIAQHAAMRCGKRTAVFSLEMSELECGMRLVSAGARVPLNCLRSGELTDADWTRIARYLGETSDAPLFVDDTPSISLAHARAELRALVNRHGPVDLVVFDYLQLMEAPGHRSRQEAVAATSRGMKLLGKEFDIPVILLSQLNRGPEQRTNKRPQMADLRECLVGDTLVTRCDTGERVPIRELAGQRDVPVWSLDEHLRLKPAIMRETWKTGLRPVYRITLASGRSVTATGNHPFYTVAGWRPVEALTAGSRLAVARSIPEPARPGRLPEAEVILLAHLIGDGCVSRDPVYYCSSDPANLDVVEKAAHNIGVDSRRTPGRGVTYVHFPMRERATHGVTNPLYDLLRRHGLYGKRSHEKKLPVAVDGLGDDQIRLFLRHLWATDGSVGVRRDHRSSRVYIEYATTSPRLAEGVQDLLTRLGIASRVRRKPATQHRQGFVVDVSGADSQRAFLRDVGVHGARDARCAEAAQVMGDAVGNPNVGCIPAEAWEIVRDAMPDYGVTSRELQAGIGMSYCGSALYKRGISRARMARVASVLPDPYLVDLSGSDVDWDRVVSVEPAGEEDVYDAVVPGTNSFLANGLISHNSGAVEQDADVIALLHRDDYYDKESPRAGEVDFIFEKNRHGPTDTITLAAQLHFCRFVSMAMA